MESRVEGSRIKGWGDSKPVFGDGRVNKNVGHAGGIGSGVYVVGSWSGPKIGWLFWLFGLGCPRVAQ